MMPLAIAAFLAAALPCAAPALQDEEILVGCDLRVVEREAYLSTLGIIDYRVGTRRAVEPLLVFSADGDPDVLGLVAADQDLPLATREVAANAILDQLYLADAYFQTCSEHYLRILSGDRERSLRLKGHVGLAALEHWYYLSRLERRDGGPRPLRLRFAAESEVDAETCAALEALAAGDPSELAGAAAWMEGRGRDDPYRSFDSLPSPALPEVEHPEAEIARAWERHRGAAELSERLSNPTDPVAVRSAAVEVLRALRGGDDRALRDFLTRFRATMPAWRAGMPLSSEFLEFFHGLARREGDPYIRALALAPVAAGPREGAVRFLLERLGDDASPLVRLSAADLLRGFSADHEVRLRMMADFRHEEDARVKLRILHAIVWPHGESPPPDILAFLLGRLRDQGDAAVLEFIVVVLGEARVASAAEPLGRLARERSDPILRERIAEALRSISRGGE